MVADAIRVGFLGLGTMGTPMAINLCRRFPVTVWNRSPGKYIAVQQAGAKIAETPSQAVEGSDVIFSMLFDGKATAETVSSLGSTIRGKTLVNTASLAVDESQSIAKQVQAAGGKFVEMPVSGSKVPAELGQLVGMMAGDRATCDSIREVVAPIAKEAVYCGPIGSGLKTKYAVNLHLITLTAGLAESMNLARAQGLDLHAVAQVIDAGPMSSAYSKLKLDKIVRQDWSPQAAIKDCYNSSELIKASIAESDARAPILKACNALYRQAKDAGQDEEDMIAVYRFLSGDAVPLTGVRKEQ